MEKKNRFLTLLFVLIALISISGFIKSYIGFFPGGNRFETIIHIHFVAFILWFCLLIAQPILIRRRNYALHKKLGKLSYVLAPVLVITIVWLVLEKVRRDIVISIDDASVEALIGLLDAVSFSAYYIAAMWNRRNIRRHVAFIIAASLIVLNPGMARLLNVIEPGAGLLGAVLLPFLVSGAIIIYEKLKLNRAVLKSPYAIFFVFWAIEIILLITVPGTAFWQSFVKNLAR